MEKYLSSFSLSNESKSFLMFVLLGGIFSFIYDFFRAIRRGKKVTTASIYIQDITYFLIVGALLIYFLINELYGEIRLYIFIAILLGVVIYMSIFGNSIRNIIFNMLSVNKKAFKFIILPLSIISEIFGGPIKYLKKIVINCCKKISYMINFKCVTKNFLKFKEKLKQKRIVLMANTKKTSINNGEVKKKKRIKVDYLRVLLIIALVYFSVTFIKQQLSINEYNVKIASVKEDISESKARIEELKEVQTKVNDAEYIEKVAREELGLIKPYEKIFIDVNK